MPLSPANRGPKAIDRDGYNNELDALRQMNDPDHNDYSNRAEIDARCEQQEEWSRRDEEREAERTRKAADRALAEARAEKEAREEWKADLQKAFVRNDPSVCKWYPNYFSGPDNLIDAINRSPELKAFLARPDVQTAAVKNHPTLKRAIWYAEHGNEAEARKPLLCREGEYWMPDFAGSLSKLVNDWNEHGFPSLQNFLAQNAELLNWLRTSNNSIHQQAIMNLLDKYPQLVVAMENMNIRVPDRYREKADMAIAAFRMAVEKRLRMQEDYRFSELFEVIARRSGVAKKDLPAVLENLQALMDAKPEARSFVADLYKGVYAGFLSDCVKRRKYDNDPDSRMRFFGRQKGLPTLDALKHAMEAAVGVPAANSAEARTLTPAEAAERQRKEEAGIAVVLKVLVENEVGKSEREAKLAACKQLVRHEPDAKRSLTGLYLGLQRDFDNHCRKTFVTHKSSLEDYIRHRSLPSLGQVLNPAHSAR